MLHTHTHTNSQKSLTAIKIFESFFHYFTLFTFLLLPSLSYAQSTSTASSEPIYPYWPSHCCLRVPQPAQSCITVMFNDIPLNIEWVDCPSCLSSCPERCPNCIRMCPGVGEIQCSTKDCSDCPCPDASSASSFSEVSSTPDASSSESGSLLSSSDQSSSVRLSSLQSSSLQSSSLSCSSVSGDAFIDAAKNGSVGVVTNMIACGCDLNARGNVGSFFKNVTALMMAAQAGHTDVVEILLAAGAGVDLGATYDAGNVLFPGGIHNETALIFAASQGHVAIVEALIAAGADINLSHSYGASPLINAAFYGQIAVVQVLITKGANLSSQDWQGYTALMYAANFGHASVVTALLTAPGMTLGIINLRNSASQTARGIAAAQGYTAIASQIATAGGIL